MLVFSTTKGQTMRLTICAIFILGALVCPNVAIATSSGTPDQTTREPDCHVREEETFFLGRSVETLQSIRYRPSDKCNETITTLEGWNNYTSSARFQCPWKHVLVTNPCRKPSVTIEVVCLPGRYTRGKIHHQCREVYFYRWIQARHQHQAGWSWTIYRVPVGCTSVRLQVKRGKPRQVTRVTATGTTKKTFYRS